MQINFNTNNPVIKRRCYDEAIFIINNCATIRQTAAHVGVSSRTAYTDLVYRLPYYYPHLFKKVSKQLSINKCDSVYRAGRESARKHRK